MAKKHNVKVTRGTFKLVGKVKGVNSKRFFENKVFDTGSERNKVNFAVCTSPTNESYVTLEGFAQKVAKFNKYDNKKKENLTKEVSWNDRFDVAGTKDFEGFNPMFGTRINLTDESDIATLFQYDACQELKESLTDGMSVYVEGSLGFTSSKKNDEVTRYKNLNVTKIYKQKEDIDFDSEKFTEENLFKQTIIFMAIDQEKNPENDKATGRFIISAKIVTADGVEDAEFIMVNKELATKIKGRLKPYNAIDVVGRLVTKVEEEEKTESVEEKGWGDEEDFDNTPSVIRFKEMIITKALPDTIDTETYSESVLASITQAEEDYGDLSSSSDDDDEVWS